MKKGREFLDRLKADGEKLPVPESLKPEWIEEDITKYEEKHKEGFQKKFFPKAGLRRGLAAAACVCLIGAALLGIYRMGLLSPEPAGVSGSQGQTETPEEDSAAEGKEEQDTIRSAADSYEEIYQLLGRGSEEIQVQNGEAEQSGLAGTESFQGAVEESQAAADESVKEYGQTNVQTEGVEEGDRIKNDGRYLYQLAVRKGEDGENFQGIQIVDTRGEKGLQETAFAGNFEYPREFYVQGDLLIVLEDGYDTADFVSQEGSVRENSAAESQEIAVCTDVWYTHNQYTKIHLYDISDRANPKLEKTFRVDGAYSTSRLADGYFYCFSFYVPETGREETDYHSYIPAVEGELIPAEDIFCPEDGSAREYLVMVSIDLSRPEEILESRAVMADSGMLYVSRENIYLSSWHSIYEDQVSVVYGNDQEMQQEGMTVSNAGTVRDYTEILRFSYDSGRFLAKAQGRFPGRLLDSFSLNESGGYLRAAATVTECGRLQMTKDETGEVLGYAYVIPEENEGLTNSLYVLDENLKITGKIEGLAAGEQIYSARFLGDTAYFVTFRQTDPLFAVDVSSPEEPELLSELKVSGFSEYLHFYGDNLLLGLGFEADENTGEQKGLKLCMFDISDPANVSEQTRLELAGDGYSYHYSPALYDYKSLLIDPERNLIGFEAQGTAGNVSRQAYLVYSYENGSFVKKLEIVMKNSTGGYDSCRGTFIGESFYLLIQDGSVQEYSLETGELLGKLK